MTLHRLHRIGACVIAVFLLGHLFNHLLAARGIEAHLSFMRASRHLYRQPLVEALLLVCVLGQVASGAWLVRRRWRTRRDAAGVLQLASGTYLAFFLAVHVAAVLVGRTVFGLNTNFYFAAAGLQLTPYRFFFIPYYFLAIVAVFAHLACAFLWLARRRLGLAARRTGFAALLAAGIVTAALVVAALSGALYPVRIPSAYLATYGV
jgi:hypothetical protein